MLSEVWSIKIWFIHFNSNLVFGHRVQRQSDACLRRFLRAFSTANDAFIMLVKCIKWRREFGVESLSDSDPDVKTEVDTGKAQLLRHRDFYGRSWPITWCFQYFNTLLSTGKCLWKIFLQIKIGLFYHFSWDWCFALDSVFWIAYDVWYFLL